MFQTLRNAWKIPDLRKKILFSLFIILIFRIGSAISVPFVEMETIRDAVSSNTGGFMDYLTLMSGGGFSNASIFALSITPYINASIIIQLLTVAIPPLERMAKDGEAGRKKLGQITRYVTVALGLMLGVAYYFMVRNQISCADLYQRRLGMVCWHRHRALLYRGFRADDVAGRADQRKGYRQRYLNSAVRGHHFPRPVSVHLPVGAVL